MTDLVAMLRSAQQRRDLVGAAEAVLRINGPEPSYSVAAALRALDPHLDETTRATAAPFLVEQPSRPDAVAFEYVTTPVDLVAVWSAHDRHRAWELLIQMGPRTLTEASAMVDVPLDLVPELLPALFAVGEHSTPKLGAFNEVLCRYHAAASDASEAWFLRWIGTTGRLVRKVASAPAWTAAVHSPEELSDLVRLIIASRRP